MELEAWRLKLQSLGVLHSCVGAEENWRCLHPHCLTVEAVNQHHR